MPVTPYSKVAFRCKNCGRLHTSADASEEPHPHSCRVCRKGVTFNPDGTKTIDSSNWEHLDKCSEERLAELGIEACHIECHKQWEEPTTNKEPVHIHVSAKDGPGTKDGVS